jgi:ankyrin repeat protein
LRFDILQNRDKPADEIWQAGLVQIMKLKWCIGFLVLATALAGAQTNNLTVLLQQGLLEEQANRNLDAAITDYQALAQRFDQDRQLAATAVFRLGECYRAQGRTNEAGAQYQRILRDFSDQPTLVTLSREDLVGMGYSPAAEEQSASGAGAAGPRPVSLEASVLAGQILGIERLKSDLEEQARAALAIFPDENLKQMLLHLPRLQAQVARLEANPQMSYTELTQTNGYAVELGSDRTDILGGLLESQSTNLLADARGELSKQNEQIEKRVAFIVGLQKARLKALQLAGGGEPAPEAAESSDVRLWNKVKDLPRNELERVLPTLVPDGMLESLLKQRSESQARLAELQTDYATSNIVYVREKTLLDVINQQTDEKITGMMQALKLRADLAANNPAAGTADAAASAAPADSDEDREIQRIQQMIQNSPDLINAPGDGGTPLGKAAHNGWQKVAAYLLDHGANVNVADPRAGGAPLVLAVAAGNKAMVKFLIERGADLNFKGQNGDTPLHLAAQKGFPAVTEVLLASHADVNVQNSSGATPLFAAVQGSQLKIVQMILAAGATVNLKDGHGWTVLNYAIGASPEIFQALLAAGTDPNTEDLDGRTPLSYAVERDSSVVKLLLAAKADPNGGKLDAPLLGAIEKQDTNSAELLLQAGANPNAMGKISGILPFDGAFIGYGTSAASVAPLYFAIAKGQLPMVKLLLKYKADPNGSQIEGRPFLFSALSDTNILEAMLDAGANIELRAQPTKVGGSWSDWTPLAAAAAKQQNVGAVKILLKHGADPNARDATGNSALHYAAWVVADEEVFTSLLDHKANPNVRNNDGKTPLDMLKNAFQDGQSWVGRFGSAAAATAYAEKLIALLHQHGALDHLPEWNHITVSRPGANYSEPVFYDESNHWNHFTLLEAIYKAGHFGTTLATLPFPDLSHLVISRPAVDGTVAKRISVNLLDATNNIDFARDVPLEFGDVIEISEREHNLAETPEYLTVPQRDALHDHFRKQAGEATLRVAGGQTVQLPLGPFHSSIGPTLERADARAALTSNSDMSRVKVTRHEPKTNRTKEWILDCSHQNNQRTPDLVLRAGDVLEVPEKP